MPLQRCLLTEQRADIQGSQYFKNDDWSGK